MAVQTRDYLKGKYKQGATPAEAVWVDLIDTMAVVGDDVVVAEDFTLVVAEQFELVTLS